MVNWMPDRSTSTFTQMGGEGVTWWAKAALHHRRAHLQPRRRHPTFTAGLRPSARASRRGEHHLQVLYNDAVAMTGGRLSANGRGPLGAADHEQPEGRGRGKLVIVTDEPQKYDGVALARGRHGAPPRRAGPHPASSARSRAAPPSSTTRPAPPKSAAAASAASWPRPTRPWSSTSAGVRGLRRLLRCSQLPVGGTGGDRIRPQAPHQPEHLQQGLLVREGLLPQLCHGGRRPAEEAKKDKKGDLSACPTSPNPSLPWPMWPWGIVVAGVGGTGVITIGQLLGMAAPGGQGRHHARCRRPGPEGRRHLSHIQIANRPDAIYHQGRYRQGRPGDWLRRHRGRQQGHAGRAAARPHLVALNTHGTPTASFVNNPNWQFPTRIATRPSPAPWAKAAWAALTPNRWPRSCWATHLEPAAAGLRVAKGPRAADPGFADAPMELNGVQVENNNRPPLNGAPPLRTTSSAVQALPPPRVIQFVKKPARRHDRQAVDFLTGYQERAYAADYRAFVEKVQAAGRPLAPPPADRAVARYLFKLIFSRTKVRSGRPAHRQGVHGQDRRACSGRGGATTSRRRCRGRQSEKGELVKKPYGPGCATPLACWRPDERRGTAFDVFGKTKSAAPSAP